MRDATIAGRRSGTNIAGLLGTKTELDDCLVGSLVGSLALRHLR